jgi:signal transduction histidine kinase
MAMSRGNLTLALLLLFLGLLGWYLIYTEQIVRTFREDTATMTRMFAEVQRGFLEPDVPLLDEGIPGARRTDEVLWRLQEIILESGVPLILTGPGDTIQAAANLPFSADLSTAEGQERAREYAQELAARNPPVGDPALFLIHYGDPPELQRLRWTPWFQVVGLLLTVVGGFFLVRFQRRADEERAWASMARELAHQLGTPISSLKGWLEVLRIAPGERPGGMVEGEIAEEIGEDVERLERVSRRFELIGRKTEFGPLRMDDVVGSVERYLNSRIPRLGPDMRLEVEVDRDLPEARGNEVLLVWALENVVKNALDALAGRGGVITVRVFHREPDWVTLQVHDTGAGVDPEIRSRLFEPGVSSKSGGWGVGLSLARRIVEQIHGGTIELLRTGETGTVFQIRLPIADPGEDPGKSEGDRSRATSEAPGP